MEHSKFNRFFLMLVLSGLALSAVLALTRFGGADNDLILRYQIAKIDRLASDGQKLDFAVLGDSSAGNGISANELRVLSGKKVENFALTGSFGLVGSLQLMKQLHEQHGVDQFILIHSPNIWNRTLEKEAIFKLLPFGSLGDYNDLIEGNARWEFFKYLINPQRLADSTKYVFETARDTIKGLKPRYQVKGDFLSQREDTFASGKKSLESPLPWKRLSKHKLTELRLVQRYCVESKLHCVVMSGPILESAYDDLQSEMDNSFSMLQHASENFRVDTSVHEFPSTWMGDTIDHVDSKRKAEVTKIYWEKISQYIRD